MGPATSDPGLDDAVRRIGAALRARSVAPPEVLLLCATGVGGLADELRHGVEVPLGELDVPEPWEPRVLHAGTLAGAAVWLVEDAAGEPLEAPPAAPWTQALPVWLAAAAGASMLVHTSAGTLLAPPDGAPAPPSLAVLRDHLNLSGGTPLVGLAASRLGPLFPDLSRLYHSGLRASALQRAAALGVPAFEAVAACTPGPSLETPAERRMYAALGADVAVQALAPPLLAAGHAGLSVLALVAVVAAGEETVDVGRLLERVRALEPCVEELVPALVADAAALARGDAATLSRGPRAR